MKHIGSKQIYRKYVVQNGVQEGGNISICRARQCAKPQHAYCVGGKCQTWHLPCGMRSAAYCCWQGAGIWHRESFSLRRQHQQLATSLCFQPVSSLESREGFRSLVVNALGVKQQVAGSKPSQTVTPTPIPSTLPADGCLVFQMTAGESLGSAFLRHSELPTAVCLQIKANARVRVTIT